MPGEDVPSHSAKKADAQHSVAESRDQAQTETQSPRIRIDTHQPTFAHRNNEKSERPQSERVENAKTMKRERNEACRAENTAQTTKASQSSASERRA